MNDYAPPVNLKAQPGHDEKALLSRLDDLQKEAEMVKTRWVKTPEIQRDLDTGARSKAPEQTTCTLTATSSGPLLTAW